MKRAQIAGKELVSQASLKFYLCPVRSILEYAVQVWENILDYLLERIEEIQEGIPNNLLQLFGLQTDLNIPQVSDSNK